MNMPLSSASHLFEVHLVVEAKASILGLCMFLYNPMERVRDNIARSMELHHPPRLDPKVHSIVVLTQESLCRHC